MVVADSNGRLKMERVINYGNQNTSDRTFTTILSGFGDFPELKQFLMRKPEFLPVLLMKKKGFVTWKRFITLSPGALRQYARITNNTLLRTAENGDQFRIGVLSKKP